MNQIRTEVQILNQWNSENKIPLVSICCTTYNHEKYIEDALNGFLSQETSFPYEILVHDDASTDATKFILEEYARKYPNIIKLITQNENKYSKGIKINACYNFPRASGKYIALCEGDDYWIDKNKLSLQVSKLEENQNINLCFHSATEQCDDLKLNTIARRSIGDSLVPLEKFITGGGEFCPTASVIFRKKIVDSLPEWFVKDAPVGDYFLQVLSAMPYGGLYIDKPMSIYRINVPGSWSSNNKTNPKYNHFVEKMIECLDKLDHHLNFKFKKQILAYKSLILYQILQNENIELNERKKFFRAKKDNFSFYEKLKWHLIYSSPLRYKIHRIIRNYI